MSAKEFETLYKEHWLMMFRTAIGITKNSENAKDITQETFTRLWANNADLSKTENIKGYLYKAVLNNSIFFNMRTAKVKEVDLSRSLHPSDKRTKIKHYVTQEHSLIDDLYKAINTMPVPHRNVFVLSRLSAMTPKEVAKQLGITLRTVKNYLVLADNLVRQRFEENYKPT